MTENTGPVPPASQPNASWPPPDQGGYPSHGPTGHFPGNEPTYGPPQPQQYAPPGYGQPQYGPPPGYGQQQQYAQPQYAPYPPQQYAPAAQWAPYPPPQVKSSGYRIAAGIVGIVLGAWLLIPACLGLGNSSSTAFMGLLVLIAALGSVTAGILLLVNQRGHGLGAPVTSLSFAGLALLLGFIGLAMPYFGMALFVSALILATPVVILMSIGLAKERRSI